MGEADILRRAMGKKKAEEMAEQKAIFVDKAIKRNFDAKKAGELFDLMAYFAGYGFNKSHSAAYALIAYQTAYLKANYPAEFMACLISLEASNAEQMAYYVHEAKDMGLTVFRPILIIHRSILASYRWCIFDLACMALKTLAMTALEDIIKSEKRDHLKRFRFL